MPTGDLRGNIQTQTKPFLTRPDLSPRIRVKDPGQGRFGNFIAFISHGQKK